MVLLPTVAKFNVLNISAMWIAFMLRTYKGILFVELGGEILKNESTKFNFLEIKGKN